jgi:hypothetical protein
MEIGAMTDGMVIEETRVEGLTEGRKQVVVGI